MGKKKPTGQTRRLKPLQKIRRIILLVGFVTTMLFAVLYVFKPAYMRVLELKLYDTFLQHTCRPPQSHAVAVVDIDEKSINDFGHWPWPRYRVALLLEEIKHAGALAVGTDILFGEPDGTSPKVLQSVIKRDLGIDVTFGGLPEELMDNDAVLARTLSSGVYTLGYSFYFQGKNRDSTEDPVLPPFRHVVGREPGAMDPTAFAIKGNRVVPPLAELLSPGTAAGFMNTITDVDGVLRRVPLVMTYKGQLYAHISLVTLITALNDRENDPIVKVGRGGMSSLTLGRTVIPLEANGAMMVNYRGPAYSFPYIPAADILEGRIPKDALKDKIVFLGSSATGLMDIRVSPLTEVFPGVEVNATIVDNILSGDFINRPDWSPGFELMMICLWGILTTVVIGWAGALLSLLAFIGLASVAWAGGFIALKEYHIWISPFFPMVVLVVNFLVLTLLKFWFSERKKKFYRSAFSRYVSRAVVDQISDNPEKMGSLSGEEKEMSILFADIRDFTSISERLSPTQVTHLLHDYFTPITRSIIKNQGTLDKFIGDAVMCFWNAPLEVPGHQELAVRTGFEMLAALNDLNRDFEIRYGTKIDIGIGLHTGMCRVGNMGSDDLFDYTIIGDNVNLTSRLEGLTKFYGVKLIISQAMKDRLGDHFVFQELDLVRVKGKDAPVGIYTVWIPPDAPCEKALSDYKSGLYLYRHQVFNQSREIFNDLSRRYPDVKAHKIYEDRCGFFLENPPPSDWDGVFTHQSK